MGSDFWDHRRARSICAASAIGSRERSPDAHSTPIIRGSSGFRRGCVAVGLLCQGRGRSAVHDLSRSPTTGWKSDHGHYEAGVFELSPNRIGAKRLAPSRPWRTGIGCHMPRREVQGNGSFTDHWIRKAERSRPQAHGFAESRRRPERPRHVDRQWTATRKKHSVQAFFRNRFRASMFSRALCGSPERIGAGLTVRSQPSLS